MNLDIAFNIAFAVVLLAFGTIASVLGAIAFYAALWERDFRLIAVAAALCSLGIMLLLGAVLVFQNRADR